MNHHAGLLSLGTLPDIMRECNVLIVGGGLSGLSAAYHLTKAGVKDIVVVERMSDAAYGHYHRTCGEAISDRSLKASGVPTGCIVKDVDSIRITFGDLDIDIPVRGHIIDRESLLEDLRSGSDAEVVRDSIVAVKSLEDGFLAVTKEEEYRCRHLIGADGTFSIVRKMIFGHAPEHRLAVVNNHVEGDSDTDLLGFEISTKYPGSYRYDFPSKEGRRIVGYMVGTDDVTDFIERGVRYIGVGRTGDVVKGRCCLVGDAAVLTNPICFGGIGAALQSGRKAAESIASDNMERYQRWVDHNIMFDHHYMDALSTFLEWDEKDYVDAVKPFRKGYSLWRGAIAIIRRPKWANVYTSIWMAFGRGW